MSKIRDFFHSIYLPPVGQRIIKTSIAVTLCLLFYALRGYRGQDMSAEAAITAIICMQPYVHDTREYAWNRIAGTLIGAFWGLLFLLFVSIFPALGKRMPVLYPLMGLGVLISLYSAVMIRQPDTSCLAAIVFVCVVIAYPDIEDPLLQAFHRILDVVVGTVVAIGVNLLHIPRKKQNGFVFFLRTEDLVPDQLSRISSSVQFRLGRLYNDGAKICLMSEHAPAFLTSQLNNIKWNVPLIVMDGAALYDANNNAYISTVTIDPTSSRWLMKRLDDMNVSYFIYTIHKDRNYIYHHGPLTENERVIYDQLKRSPYRHYLDDDHFTVSEIVYLKIVAADDMNDHIYRNLKPYFSKMKIRAVIRPQAGMKGGNSLYFYAANADIAHAQQHLMRILHEYEPALVPQEVLSETGYQSEHDAIHLLQKLSNQYEPPYILSKFRKAK